MKKVANEVSNIGVSEGNIAFQLKAGHPPLSDSALLSLHQRLQVSLNTGVLVSHLFSWLGELLPLVGVEYIYPEEFIEIRNGESRQHRAHYVLRLQQRYLGEVTLYGSKRLADQQLHLLEHAMGVFVHYLKNALDHLALEKAAYHCSLTTVMNRMALDELLPKEVDRAERYQYDLSVAMIDIDHFKSINDRIGHLGGDKVLCVVSRLIKAHLRSSDLTFRYGGDEFLVVMPNTGLEGARTALRHIMEALKERSVEVKGHTVQPELSIGVTSREVGETPSELLLRVDNALYDAKNMGRNCIG